MLGLHFTPACVLLSVCSLHFTLSLHFTPGPQSAFYTDRKINFQFCLCQHTKNSADCAFRWVPGHVYRKLRIKNWSVKSLGWKKGSRLRLCFRVVDDVAEKKGMDFWKQMASSKCSFTCICGIFLPLNPSTSTVYARSAFYPGLRFTLSLQSAFYTQSAFYPWSAVCSPKSA